MIQLNEYLINKQTKEKEIFKGGILLNRPSKYIVLTTCIETKAFRKTANNEFIVTEAYVEPVVEIKASEVEANKFYIETECCWKASGMNMYDLLITDTHLTDNVLACNQYKDDKDLHYPFFTFLMDKGDFKYTFNKNDLDKVKMFYPKNGKNYGLSFSELNNEQDFKDQMKKYL